ncbi:MAG: phospholipase A [Gammaproteobacteria bacterium]|nr:phospholipase A [Gammaproteobacteria bacterium]
MFPIGSSDFGERLDHAEIQFQLSIKAAVAEGIFTESGTLFVGATVRAFWQAYNSEISAPFRETNYEPEVFWVTSVPWKILGGDATLFSLGL